jgi:glycosyltransferase involved in cell wall biosynthesis
MDKRDTPMSCGRLFLTDYFFYCTFNPSQSKFLSLNIIFAGKTEDIHHYLSGADIFVMPSDFEGMPNAVIEAMDYGMPCVSTNKTGALDVARDVKESLFVDVGSGE